VGAALLLKALKQNLDPKIPLREIDAHINDLEFADTCVNRFLEVVSKPQIRSKGKASG
jgi:uncharacterized protein (UPF0261 family)